MFFSKRSPNLQCLTPQYMHPRVQWCSCQWHNSSLIHFCTANPSPTFTDYNSHTQLSPSSPLHLCCSNLASMTSHLDYCNKFLTDFFVFNFVSFQSFPLQQQCFFFNADFIMSAPCLKSLHSFALILRENY